MRQEIEDYRIERGIPFLLHFTREANLASIIQHGIVPRSEVSTRGLASEFNDPNRLDGRTAFNCLSVSFPNSQMFYRFQMDHPDVQWPILVIHPLIMAHKEVLFCRHNAADSRISGKPACELSNLDSFKGMFEEIAGLPS
jgi:hypothetical protein